MLILIALVLAPTAGWAQGRDKGVYCPMHQFSQSCDGVIDCDRAWAEHVRNAHRGPDADSYWDRVTPASFSVRGTPAYVGLRALLLGGSVGALAGSVVKGPDPESFREQAGVYIGSGTFLGLGTLANRRGWRPIPSMLAGGAAGAALGTGVGKALEKNPRGTPARKAEQERTQQATIQGLAIGTGSGLFLSTVGKLTAWQPPGAGSPWRRFRVQSTSGFFRVQWFWQ